MDRTITALYENRADAEQASRRLLGLGVDQDDMDIRTADSGDRKVERDGTGGHGRGLLGALKDMFLPHEDRDIYDEGLRRGHALLTVRADDAHADAVVRELDSQSAIDVDARSQEWEQSGWRRQDIGASRQTASGQLPSDTGGTMAARDTDYSDETRIPVGEERLVVGKREVERGGARVRSYVVETPVHEQVRLREEHGSIERRPLDELASDPDALFQEREIEMTETAEEPVIGKETRVREEVVLRKDAEEHVEDIDDTVRHTEVEVDDHLAARGAKKKPGEERPGRSR